MDTWAFLTPQGTEIRSWPWSCCLQQSAQGNKGHLGVKAGREPCVFYEKTAKTAKAEQILVLVQPLDGSLGILLPLLTLNACIYMAKMLKMFRIFET